MRSIFLIGAAMATTVPNLAAAKDKLPAELAHVGKWEVNYDKDSCHLLGKFGAGDQEVIARFTRYEPGDAMELRLYGKLVGQPEQFQPVSVDFGPVTNPQKMESLIGASGKVPMAFYGFVRLDDWSPTKESAIAPAITPDDEAKVTYLTIKAPRGKHFKLLTGPMAGTMRAMRRCTDNLIKSWNFDPAEFATMTAPPKPLSDPRTWLRDGDYPLSMVYNGSNGLIQFRLDLDQSGSVSKCAILDQAGDNLFAKLTCELISKRAKFSSAVGKNGQPIRSFYINKVRWIMRH